MKRIPSSSGTSDVGEALVDAGVRILPENRLWRGGSIIENPSVVEGKALIIGLRSESEAGMVSTPYWHHPFPKHRRKYDLRTDDVRVWLLQGVERIHCAPTPVLVHCAHGVDRTGMLVGAYLLAIGAPHTAIVSEYSRHPGARPEVFEEFMHQLRDGPIAAQLKLCVVASHEG